jgi:hypothetical protein
MEQNKIRIGGEKIKEGSKRPLEITTLFISIA